MKIKKFHRHLNERKFREGAIDAAFVRLTKLAAKFLKTPEAQISLAGTGLAPCESKRLAPGPPSASSLSHFLCQYVATQKKHLAVSDSRKHRLLRKNPEIQNSEIIAFLGVPLVFPHGEMFGVFYVTDSRPRHWRTEQIEILNDLAASLLSEIELNRLRSRNSEHPQVEEALQSSEARLRAIYESLTQGVVFLDTAGKVISINRAVGNVLGRSLQELTDPELDPRRRIVRSDGSLFPVEEQPAMVTLRTGEPVHDVEMGVPFPDGTMKWIIVNSQLVSDTNAKILGVVVTFVDNTDARQAETELIKLNRVYSVISQINQAIVRIKEPEKLFEKTCQIAVELGKFQMAWVGLVEKSTPFVRPVAFAGVEAGYLSKIKHISISDIPEGRGPTGTAIREGKHFVCSDIENDPRMATWRDEALKRGYRSSIALPLKLSGKVIGAFSLYASVPRFFDRNEIDLLNEVANDLSFALEAIDTEKQRTRTEKALRESEQRYRLILENSLDAILLTEPDGGIYSANPAACKMFQRTEADICKLGRSGLVDLHDPRIPVLLEERKRTGSARGEILMLRKDGTVFPVEVSTSVFTDRKGEFRTSMIIRDMTRQKQAEEKLRYHDQLLNEMSRIAHIGAWEFDVETLQGTWTDETARIHDLNPANETNVEFGLSFYSDESRSKIERAVQEAIEKNKPYDLELELVTAPGNKKWVRTIGHPIREKGKIVKVRGTFQDITARKRTEAEIRDLNATLEERVAERTAQLQSANEKLVDADRLKSIFLASMSHELRTPLNSIIGFTGILLMGMTGPLSAEQKKQLTMVKNSASHLLSLINDLLDVSKIEAEKVELVLDDFLLNDLVHEVTTSFLPLAEAKKLTLQVKLPPSTRLYSDKRRVKQVLINLVSNAIKYSQVGSIEITARRIKGGRLQVSVADTGIGISTENLNRLFSPFQQIDESLTKSQEGTGLGLYLCKKLCLLLNGDISVKSIFGEGSTFTFQIPQIYEGKSK